ncbi:hypothetical protein BD413DRAFT_472079 [Trametes elegans]|nr:hypothetical protein BD413DRAFT_472079 [Trametes elegans]
MLPFVPRKVAHKTKSRVPASAATKPPIASAPAAPALPEHSSNHAKGKHKHVEPTASDTDLAVLLWLSLSDHALWLNVDLRRALAAADDGWIPLSTLFRLSAYFALVDPSPPESAYVKALRAHAAELFEIRMRVSAPSKAGWYAAGPSSANPGNDGGGGGGYEVRRKDWREALPRARNSTRAQWEARTAYMECIPLAHRALPAAYHFATALLDLPRAGPTLTPRIQSVVLPAHHLDRPGDVPKPKGFALVTFADEADAARLAEEWPWLPRRTAAPDGAAAPEREGVKFGFRALRKARWDALQEEYRARRHQLLDDHARAEGGGRRAERDAPPQRTVPPVPAAQDDTPRAASQPPPETEPDESPAPAPSLTASAPFPPGCLVYARHVHPETNKTTLKALLAAHARVPPAALDYVDYSKGMAACHLRLSAPHHARALVSAFEARPLAQRSGLDSTGAPPAEAGPDSARAIAAEVVAGTREELYWSKVPEKVRREAVRRAILAQAPAGERGGDDPDAAEADGGRAEEQAETGRRKRKRRRKA